MLRPGTTVGRYRIEETVGTGAFGVVHRGFDERLDRPVAIKVLKTGRGGETDSALREARAASALNHPSIVTVHDVGEHDGQPFIVMEWIDGQTLRSMLPRKPLEVRRAAEIAIHLASALSSAHEAGIVHRDLKPENIRIRPDGLAKILDFGLARFRTSQSRSAQETPTRGLVGTVAYMAPEQLDNQALDGRCDAFALGIIVYEMLTGLHPFAAETTSATMQRILNAEPSPPSSHVALPSGWDDVVLQLLAKDRAARATEVDLLNLLRAEPGRFAAGPDDREAAPPFVGRASELKLLADRWTLARRGSGSCVLLSAETGAGKTTLTQHFLRGLENDPHILTATGRCSERLGSGEAYLPFLEALTALASSTRGGLVRAVLKSKAPTWFVQLFPASSSDASFEQLRREITGGSQERMRRELVDALSELCRSYSICLVLEDLHWSDLATTELMGYLSKRLGEVSALVIGTYRPAELMAEAHPLRPILLDMQARGVAVELSLGLLGERDIQSYVDLEFPGHRFPTHFSAWLAQKTEGNPLFLVDLLRYLTERQALVKGAHWELVRPVEDLEGEVPASVRALIERTLQMLSEEQRRWLTVAAVQGESFDSLTLSEVTETDELHLEEQLEILHRMQRLVRPLSEREFPDGSITVEHRFVHVLYQETLYGGLAAKRRMLLHERIGRSLERRHGSRATSIAAELAVHFDRARKPAEAVSYYLRAAENAAAKFAHVQAVGYCDRAQALARSLPDPERDRHLMATHKARGSALFVMSRFEEASPDFEQMLQCAERLREPDGEAHALCLLAECNFFLKEGDRLERQVERALRIAGEHNLPDRAAEGRRTLGLQRMCYGRLDEADELLSRAAKDSEEPGGARTRALGQLAQIWFFRGEYERVLAFSKQAEALAIEDHDAFALLVSHFFTGLTEVSFGQLAEGVRTLRRGRGISEKNSDLFWLGRFPNCLGWVHHEALDFEQALAINEEAVTIARETGFLEPEANSAVNVGLACVELGDLERARIGFQQAEDIFARDDWFRWRYRLRLDNGWSDLYLRLGDLEEARSHAAQCQKSAQLTGSRKHLALAHRQLGRIALLENKIAEAEKHLTKAIDLTSDLQMPLATWRCYLSAAELYDATHRSDQAATSRATALQILKNLAEGADEGMGRALLQSKTVRDLGG